MRPNILYIHSHDTGRYIQPYGHAIPTPNFQHLAEQGVLFRQAFCAAPTCSPSRAALLTGQSPHSAGMLGLAHRGFSLKDYSQHLVHTLKAAGYVTALAGVQHVGHSAAQIGYDIALTEGIWGNKGNEVVPAAEKYLREYGSNPSNQPFFLSVGFVETHREFAPAGWQEDPRYCLPPAPLPDTPETRQDMADFKASARIFDRSVGTILDLLDELSLTENTLVICTTDHGIAFPRMKCNLTDHGIGVMLIMRGPGGFSGGKVIDSLVSQIDIFPTICEYLGISQPMWLQGKSILPLIRGEKDQINQEIFAEVTYHAAYEPMRAIRTNRYKYIRRFDENLNPILPNCDDSHSKSVLLKNGWGERNNPTESLFDLVDDPHEANNCINDPDYNDITNDLRKKLHAWMERTDDIILEGLPVKAPQGAVINLQQQRSPNDPVTRVD